MALGLFDLLVVVVGGVGYGIGRERGLVWQASGILTLLLGGACATILSLPFGPLFTDGILGRFAAWVVIYALVAICLYVISLKLKHRIEELEFDELDKRFGGMLGAFKALLVFGVVVIVAVCLSGRVEAGVKGSASGRALQHIVTEMGPLLPERVHERLDVEKSPLTREDPPQPEPQSPAPSPTKPQPAQPSAPVVEVDADETEPPPPPRKTRELPEEADPFDTSKDAPDPLAPPK